MNNWYGVITLYHGSDREIRVEDIVLPGPRRNCDFGDGFYLAEERDTAIEWAAKKDGSHCLNTYELDFSQRKPLLLEGEEWARVVSSYRTRRFRVRFDSDAVIGMIANDRMSDVLPLFEREIIGAQRLRMCLDLAKFGNQVCIKRTTVGLRFVECKRIEGFELRDALDRFARRQTQMEERIRAAIRTPVANEAYISDFVKMGDWVEGRTGRQPEL